MKYKIILLDSNSEYDIHPFVSNYVNHVQYRELNSFEEKEEKLSHLLEKPLVELSYQLQSLTGIARNEDHITGVGDTTIWEIIQSMAIQMAMYRDYSIAYPNHAREDVYSSIYFLELEDDRTLDGLVSFFRTECRQLFQNRGGDDDTFDYVPSFCDMFYQVCRMFPEKFAQDWNDFYKYVVTELGDDPIDELCGYAEPIEITE